MTALSKAALRALWISHFQPTSGNFSDLIDSWTDYSDTLATLDARVSAGGVGLIRAVSTTSVSFQALGAVGATFLAAAATTATALGALGGGAVGVVVFGAATTAAAQGTLGGGAVGITLFATATTAAVQAIVGSGLAAASQAQMESAAVDTVAVTPLRQQSHPSSPKAWVNFHGLAATSVRSSFNVSSVVFNGTGDYSIVFTTPFSNIAYCPVFYADVAINAANAARAVNITSVSAGGLRIFTTSSGAAEDQEVVTGVFFGDQ